MREDTEEARLRGNVIKEGPERCDVAGFKNGGKVRERRLLLDAGKGKQILLWRLPRRTQLAHTLI